MSHQFRERAAAVADSAFAAWGDEARYTSADGVAVDTVAIVKTADIVALAPRQRARQTGRLLELKRTDIEARPTKGAHVVIGSLTYAILDDAKSEDALGLVWTCRVSVFEGRQAALAFVLAAPLCVASAELGPVPIYAGASFTLAAPVVFATAFAPVAGQVAATLPAPSVVATAEVTAGRAASLDFTLPAPSLVAAASLTLSASAVITLPAPEVTAAAGLSLATVNAVTLPAPVASGAAVSRVAGVASFTLPAPGVVASAVLPVSAAAAFTLAAPVVSASAVRSNGPVAEASITLPAPTASGVARVGIASSAAPSLPAPSVSSSAVVGLLPYAGITLPAPAVVAAATVRGAGVAAITLPAPTVSAAAQLSIATVNAVTLPAPLASGVSTVALGAAVAFTLSAPSVAAAATVALAPAATANTPGLTVSAAAVAAIMASAGITLAAPAVTATAERATPVVYKALTYVGGKAGNFVGATSGNTNVALGSGLTGGIASAVAADDLVIVAYATGSTADRTLAIGDGSTAYTLIGSEQYVNATTNDTNLRVAYKRMGSTPDANIVLGPSGNAADGAGYAVHVWRNVDAVTPLDVTPTAATATATSRPNPPAITPVTPGAIVIAATGGAAGTGTTAFVFSGASNLVQDNGADTQDGRASLASYAWTSGALDPAASSAGSNNSADSWAAITFALRPAVDVAPPAAPPVAYAASSTHDVRSDATLTIACPSDVVAGNLMVACIGIALTNGIVSAPSGWTLYAHNSTSDGVVHAIFYKIATGSEPSSYTFTCTGGPYTEGVIFRVTGENTSSPMDVYRFATGTSGSTRPVASITTTEANTLLVYFCGGSDAVTGAPAGMTAIWTGSGFGIWVEDRPTAGATGSRAASQTSSFWAATMFAIKGA